MDMENDYDWEAGREWEPSELFLAAASGNMGKVLSAGHWYLTEKYMAMARYLRTIQEAAITEKPREEYLMWRIGCLEREVEDLRARHPGGRKETYTRTEKEQVVLLRRKGISYEGICRITGMSKNTVTRVLREARERLEAPV